MPTFTIKIDKDETKVLEKRAKKNLMTVKEQIQDIINSNPEVLYIGPSYLEIELTGNCDLVLAALKSIRVLFDKLDGLRFNLEDNRV